MSMAWCPVGFPIANLMAFDVRVKSARLWLTLMPAFGRNRAFCRWTTTPFGLIVRLLKSPMLRHPGPELWLPWASLFVPPRVTVLSLLLVGDVGDSDSGAASLAVYSSVTASVVMESDDADSAGVFTVVYSGVDFGVP